MITPGEFIAVLASELALHGVPNGCAFSAVEFHYPEGGIAFQLSVIFEGKGVAITNFLKTEEIAAMGNPISEIGVIVSSMRAELEKDLAPKMVQLAASIN